MGSDDLTTRLLASIEETERDALWAAHPGQWASWESIANPLAVGLDGKTRLERMAAATLRRCAADRKIVELHKVYVAAPGVPMNIKGIEVLRDVYACRGCSAGLDLDVCPTIRALAEGYGLTTAVVPDGHHDH